MPEPNVFIKAEQALKKVVDRIKDEQWAMAMPPDFVMRQVDRVEAPEDAPLQARLLGITGRQP